MALEEQEEFSRCLHDLLQDLDLSDEDLARLLTSSGYAVSASLVQKWTRGERLPPKGTSYVDRIIYVLHLSHAKAYRLRSSYQYSFHIELLQKRDKRSLEEARRMALVLRQFPSTLSVMPVPLFIKDMLFAPVKYKYNISISSLSSWIMTFELQCKDLDGTIIDAKHVEIPEFGSGVAQFDVASDSTPLFTIVVMGNGSFNASLRIIYASQSCDWDITDEIDRAVTRVWSSDRFKSYINDIRDTTQIGTNSIGVSGYSIYIANLGFINSDDNIRINRRNILLSMLNRGVRALFGIDFYLRR